MKIKEFSEPRGHIVIDDFLPKDELVKVLVELGDFERSMKIGLQGSAINLARREKQNRICFLNQSTRTRRGKNILYPAVFTQLMGSELQAKLKMAKSPAFQILKSCHVQSLQLSAYGNEDFYGMHKDDNPPANLTFVLFLCREPKRFKGGDFILEYENFTKKVAFKNNRALLFSSDTNHMVSHVNLKGNRFADRRFSVQIWPALRVLPRHP